MGMDVDEAGRDRQPGGFDHFARFPFPGAADRNDPIAANGKIADEGFAAAAIDKSAAADQDIAAGRHSAASRRSSAWPSEAQKAPSREVSTSTAPRTPSAARASCNGRWNAVSSFFMNSASLS